MQGIFSKEILLWACALCPFTYKHGRGGRSSENLGDQLDLFIGKRGWEGIITSTLCWVSRGIKTKSCLPILPQKLLLRWSEGRQTPGRKGGWVQELYQRNCGAMEPYLSRLDHTRTGAGEMKIHWNLSLVLEINCSYFILTNSQERVNEQCLPIYLFILTIATYNF